MKIALYYLVEYGILAAIALPLACFAMLRARTDRAWRSIVIATSWLTILVAGWMIFLNIPNVMHDGWSQSRLAPAIAWIKGDRLYYGERDGPVLVRMYGPVSAIIYAPTALASRPTITLLIGATINLICFVAPAAWFIRRANHANGTLRGAHAIAPYALFATLAFLGSRLLETATTVTIDAPAIGFMACACAVLLGSFESTKPFRRGLVCGLLATMSIWCKQTMAPALIALVVYAIVSDQRARGARCAIGIIIAFVVVSIGIVLAFGPRELFFDMFVVPSRHPWQWPWLGKFDALLRAARTIWREAAIASITLITFVALNARRNAGDGDARTSVFRQPWVLPAIVAGFVVPTSALAIVKISGQGNNAAATCYFLILAACSALGAAMRCEDATSLNARARFIRLAFVGISTFAMFITIARERRNSNWRRMQDWTHLSDNPVERAFAVARAHPGEYYFPQYPLASILAEWRAYPSEAGVDDLNFARITISPERLQRALPAQMRAIAYSGAPAGPMPALLPAFTKRITDPPELGSGWTLLVRPE